MCHSGIMVCMVKWLKSDWKDYSCRLLIVKDSFACIQFFFGFTGLQVYMPAIDLGTDLLNCMLFYIIPKNNNFWKVYRFTGLHVFN